NIGTSKLLSFKTKTLTNRHPHFSDIRSLIQTNGITSRHENFTSQLIRLRIIQSEHLQATNTSDVVLEVSRHLRDRDPSLISTLTDHGDMAIDHVLKGRSEGTVYAIDRALMFNIH